MRRLTWVVGVLVLAAGASLAGELAGVALPDATPVGDSTLVLNGMGLRTKLFIKVYVGALYLKARSSDVPAILAADEPMRMVMHFLYKEVEAEKVTAAWREGFASNSAAELPALQQRLDRFCSLWVTMRKGQVATMTYVPGTGTTLELDGKAVGTVPGRDFARALLAVWLGEKPPDKGLRSGVLGL